MHQSHWATDVPIPEPSQRPILNLHLWEWSLEICIFNRGHILRTMGLTAFHVSHLESTLHTVATRGILLKHTSDHILLLFNALQWPPSAIRIETLASKCPLVRPHLSPPLTSPHCGSIPPNSSDSFFGFAVGLAGS